MPETITKTYELISVKGVKGWIRDSWARRQILALQQAIAGIVFPTASTANPQMDGTAAPGVSTDYSRADHVHPHDSTKADVSAIPTKTSDLTNDSGFITSAPVTSVNGQTGAVALDATDVGALPSSTAIPSKTSDLTNDSGFITSSAVPSASTSNPVMDGTASAGSSTAWARGDHVHPSDTSKQDALSAAQLAAVNTAANYPTYYGTCDTAGATQEKAVTCPGFVLVAGARIAVKFAHAQTYNATSSSPVTMNVNGTGAVTVAYRDAYTVQRYYWADAEVVEFVYDGSNYIMFKGGMATTTYYGITKLTNSLTSTNSALALNAAAGKSLQDQINALSARITALGG